MSKGTIGPEAVPNETSSPRGARQRSDFFERILAYRIEHRRDAIALRQSPDRADEILRAVHDCRVADVCAGNLGFLLGPHRANDHCAKVLGPLAKNEAHTARRGMNQDSVTGLDGEGGEYEVVGRDPLCEDQGRPYLPSGGRCTGA